MASSKTALSAIENLRKRYYKALPGKESLLQLINETEASEQVYNSNAIENSSLTLEETEKILMQVELDRYVSERELFEAKNLARVVAYTNQKAATKELNFDTILLLHQMLISNIRDEIAGRFREPGEYVKVANHIAPAPEDIPELLTKALHCYQGTAFEHIATRIATLHLEFENIHPFVDGNGRIGRAIVNYLLVRDGYVPINFQFSSRAEYYQAFKEYDLQKKSVTMENIVALALTNSYHKRLAYLEGKQIVKLSDYAKRSGETHSSLLNKAKRQTIEAFTEKNQWKIVIAE